MTTQTTPPPTKTSCPLHPNQRHKERQAPDRASTQDHLGPTPSQRQPHLHTPGRDHRPEGQASRSGQSTDPARQTRPASSLSRFRKGVLAPALFTASAQYPADDPRSEPRAVDVVAVDPKAGHSRGGQFAAPVRQPRLASNLSRFWEGRPHTRATHRLGPVPNQPPKTRTPSGRHRGHRTDGQASRWDQSRRAQQPNPVSRQRYSHRRRPGTPATATTQELDIRSRCGAPSTQWPQHPSPRSTSSHPHSLPSQQLRHCPPFTVQCSLAQTQANERDPAPTTKKRPRTASPLRSPRTASAGPSLRTRPPRSGAQPKRPHGPPDASPTRGRRPPDQPLTRSGGPPPAPGSEHRQRTPSGPSP